MTKTSSSSNNNLKLAWLLNGSYVSQAYLTLPTHPLDTAYEVYPLEHTTQHDVLTKPHTGY